MSRLVAISRLSSDNLAHEQHTTHNRQKIRTLVQIADDLRHGKDFSIARLTLLKSLCSDPDAAAQFALYLAKKTQQTMKVHGRPRYIKPEAWQRYQRLANKGVRGMVGYLNNRTSQRESRLHELLQIQDEQNEFRRQQWVTVRIIDSMELLVVETALELRPQPKGVVGTGVRDRTAVCQTLRQSVWQRTHTGVGPFGGRHRRVLGTALPGPRLEKATGEVVHALDHGSNRRTDTLAYSESLARRVRQVFAGNRAITEKKMFGGIGFLLHGNMCVGISQTSLIVRLGPEQADAARGQPHVVEFDVTGRPLRGWVMVEADGIETDEQLSTMDRAGRRVRGNAAEEVVSTRAAPTDAVHSSGWPGKRRFDHAVSKLHHGVTFLAIACALEVDGDISIRTDVHGISSPEIGRPGRRCSRPELVPCTWV